MRGQTYTSTPGLEISNTNQILSEAVLVACFHAVIVKETETAGFCILRGKDTMNLDKIIKIFSKMFSFVHPAFHESFFKRNPCVQGVNFG